MHKGSEKSKLGSSNGNFQSTLLIVVLKRRLRGCNFTGKEVDKISPNRPGRMISGKILNPISLKSLEGSKTSGQPIYKLGWEDLKKNQLFFPWRSWSPIQRGGKKNNCFLGKVIGHYSKISPFFFFFLKSLCSNSKSKPSGKA